METQTFHLSDLRTQITTITKESERLNTLLAEREYELSNLKLKISNTTQIEQRLNMLLREKEELIQERNKLRVTISEKTRELEMFSAKASDINIVLVQVREIREEKENLERSLAKLTLENNSLRFKASSVVELEQKIEMFEKTKRHLTQSIVEKDKMIAELNVQISAYEYEDKDTLKMKGKVSALISENKRIQAELEAYKSKGSSDSSVKVKKLLLEKEKLDIIITEQVREIEILKARLNVLDHEKVNQLTSENKRLSLTILEHIEVIKEWEHKYRVLEKLYLSVKEATDELHVIKKKYQDAVITSEREEPSLRTSVDGRVTKKKSTVTFEKNMYSSSREQSSAKTSIGSTSLTGSPQVKIVRHF